MTPEERERTRRYVERLDGRYRTLRDEVEEDVAPVRGLSPGDIDRRMAALLRSAWRVLEGLPASERARLLRREPPAPDFPATWARLVAQYKARG